MSRAGIKNDDFDLAGTIDKYKEKNDLKNAVGKEVKKLGDDIKLHITKQGTFQDDEYLFSSETYTASVKVKQNEDFDEEKAIEILKENLTKEQLKKVIKTKEYIDDDMLEKMMYTEAFDPQILASCKVVKDPTYTLRISKKK